MSIKAFVRRAAAFILVAVLLCPAASAASSGDVITVALGEVGKEEGENEYTKYGAWYGVPNGYWCDMFVSWCANMAGVPAAEFPRHCACTEHVKRFEAMGRYQASAARGGTYIPKQGDVIFFYNPNRYPKGNVKNHTGLVLYVENGYVYTIEGNALANRLDMVYTDVSERRIDALEPPDYVTVNCYSLDAPHIHGYGVPAYDDRTPLELEGIVDLGRFQGLYNVVETICAEGIMTSTSTHTFSPNHGMTRGDFTALVMDFFGLAGYDPATECFGDVPEDSPYYEAVMTARSAGIINDDGTGLFRPGEYVSPQDASTILLCAQEYVGMDPIAFSFSEGDYSYILNRPYAIRIDIAEAFFTLREHLPLTAAFDGTITLDGRSLDWDVRTLSTTQELSCYVAWSDLRQEFLELGKKDEPAFIAPDFLFNGELPSYEPKLNVSADERVPAALGATDRVALTNITLHNDTASAEAAGFVYNGVLYVELQAAAELLAVDIAQAEDVSQPAIVLVSR